MIPSLRGWHQQYADQGLVVIGNHYPEFNFERDINAVRESLVRLDVPYPVLQDNGRETWNAYNNRFWPALYLIDRQGRIRYRHFGEGRYEQTDQAIRDLLREPWDASASPVAPLPPGLTSTDILNVRSGPGLDHDIIGLISPGEVYQRHGEQEGWYRIRHQGREGYVSGEYVTLSG
ncbi:MAG: SH3 domain-containing protein [Anaerolineaceae bacterium]|nr:SH3 domain-containing protein [Anaerolineaceae bacterium]